mgnify:CR=1 FL=1
MIHNDTTRSAERRNTLSFSVYLCVCLFLEKKRGSQKKKAKKTAQSLSRGRINLILRRARTVSSSSRETSIWNHVANSNKENLILYINNVCFSFHVVLRGQRERVP